jgi:aspartyl-tRNA(Asn)/glutamyl-tRNA(Gln) amidotransferase subunit A
VTDPALLSSEQACDLLRTRQISAVELTQAVLDRIVALDNEIKAYLTLVPEMALQQAAEADRRRAEGEDHPLLGMPLAIKDVISVEGVPMTCGSRILEDYVPPFSAAVVDRLREAGAVILGKTNTDEFAMGSSTENSGYFTTRNPWDLDRVPGGSSGGSAAAVAAGLAFGALGSDTGGSVRQPAALCGIVGLKPTYGRVSRWGLVAFASSLDQIGPLARSVAGVANLLETIAGPDARDSTCADRPVPPYAAALTGEVRGLRIGLPREYLAEGLQPEVEAAVREAVDLLSGLGAQVSEVSLPHTDYALPAYYLIAPAEASANLARYDGMRYGLRVAGEEGPTAAGQRLGETYCQTRGVGLGPEVKRRIMLGTYALSAGYYDAYYLKASKVRTLIRRDFDQALAQCDVLLAPTTPTTAFRVGEKMDDPLQMYLQDIFTLALSLAGLCGLSLPCGFDGAGLPIGLQIMGRAFEEATVLRVAHAYEQATEWHKRRIPQRQPVDEATAAKEAREQT